MKLSFLILTLWAFGTIATGDYVQIVFPIAALVALYIAYNEERKRNKDEGHEDIHS